VSTVNSTKVKTWDQNEEGNTGRWGCESAHAREREKERGEWRGKREGTRDFVDLHCIALAESIVLQLSLFPPDQWSHANTLPTPSGP